MRGLHGFLFTFLILFLTFFPASLAEEFYVVEEAALVVYRNGDVKVRIVLSVNETEPVITLPLLTSSVSDLLIFNETGHLIPYEIEDHNLTIFSLGSTNVTVEYYTNALTSKEAELWTLNFTSPFYLTVELPENATIMYLSDIPSAITIEEGKIILDIYPGEWEISYAMPVQPPSSPPPSQPSPQPPSLFPLTLEHILIIAGIGACILILAFAIFIIRRRREIESLRSEEIEVLRFLREKGGRALEAEIRERFPDIPRTSMWRLIRRLERQGKVRVRKVGLQNLVELK